MTAKSTPTGLPAGDRPHTHEMVVVHRVFRRESALLPRLVRAVPDGASARAGEVAAYLDDYVMGLHHHHALEDELIWPLLRERAAARRTARAPGARSVRGRRRSPRGPRPSGAAARGR